MLQIEPFVLRSAVQAYLESDPEFSALGVVFTDQHNGMTPVDLATDWSPTRVIGLELHDPMLTFELTVDGMRQDFPYQGMDHLAAKLTAACAPVRGR